MTEKLYYKDSHMSIFTARVLSCEKSADGYRVILDGTAFFPEGGGQLYDTGTLGSVNVLRVFEENGEAVHITDGALCVGESVDGMIDWDTRFKRMQSHSGEHIVSGIVHSRYGFDNVGFHMGADGVIVDFDGFLTPEQLSEVEEEANRVITADVPVTAAIYSPDEIKNISYRSKLDLKENVRLVTIEGCDVCACCAPHVSRTGEIGVIKILDSIRRKDGVRIRMLAGKDAFSDYRQKSKSVSEISALLSAKTDAVTGAVERVLREKEKLSWDMGSIIRRMAELITENADATSGNMVFFEPLFDTEGLRLLVNAAMPKCGGICAAFSGTDEDGYKYVMGSSLHDLRAEAREINTALSGRGGGTPEMIQGSVNAKSEDIRRYFGV